MNIHFDWLAPIYDRVISQPEPDKLRQLLGLPAGRLLEAGGGTGRIAAMLAPLVNTLVLSDRSRPMLQQARRKGDIQTVASFTERLPFPSDSFDAVLVVDALHHFTHQAQAVAELVRVLKPGGRLVIEEPDIARFAVKLVALAEKLALMGSHFHSAAQIKAMVTACGASARIESDGGFAVWIVADK